MTNEDYSKVPPPHLLKKFSEQARVDSQKRGHSGYCKTFAKLCIDWAFQEALTSKSSPNYRQIRSSDIVPPSELTEQWCEQLFGCPDKPEIAAYELVRLGAQYGADQELEACCHYFTRDLRESLAAELRTARRPKPPSLKEQALEAMREMQIKPCIINGVNTNAGLQAKYDIIRRALEQLSE